MCSIALQYLVNEFIKQSHILFMCFNDKFYYKAVKCWYQLSREEQYFILTNLGVVWTRNGLSFSKNCLVGITKLLTFILDKDKQTHARVQQR
jgi:hypothetical protein